jgi:hypothetical protein
MEENTNYRWKAGQNPLNFIPDPNQYPYILCIDSDDDRIFYSSDFQDETSFISKSRKIGFRDVEEFKIQTKKEKLIKKLKEFKV